MIQERLIQQIEEAERKALSKNLHECIAGLNYINGMVQGAYYSQHIPCNIYNMLSERLNTLIQQKKAHSTT